MITEFDTYKSEDRLEIGDYVICKNLDPVAPNDVGDFIEKSIGKYIEYDNSGDFKYAIKYEKSPECFISYNSGDVLYCHRNEISSFSKNKEDLELILNTKKYNL